MLPLLGRPKDRLQKMVLNLTSFAFKKDYIIKSYMSMIITRDMFCRPARFKQTPPTQQQQPMFESGPHHREMPSTSISVIKTRYAFAIRLVSISFQIYRGGLKHALI